MGCAGDIIYDMLTSRVERIVCGVLVYGIEWECEGWDDERCVILSARKRTVGALCNWSWMIGSCEVSGTMPMEVDVGCPNK